MPSLHSRAPGIPKLYPNLNPAAAIPVDRDQVFHVREFFDQFRMTRGREHGQYVPNSKYIFVRSSGGDLMMHPQYRHPAIASGKPVLYAGEAYFNNGRLEWWSNGSGNYRPDSGHAEQAGLPIESFYTYEDILKGKHKSPHLRQNSNGESGGEQDAKSSGSEVQAKLVSGLRPHFWVSLPRSPVTAPVFTQFKPFAGNRYPPASLPGRSPLAGFPAARKR